MAGGLRTNRMNRVASKCTCSRFPLQRSGSCPCRRAAAHRCDGAPMAANCSTSRLMASSWRFPSSSAPRVKASISVIADAALCDADREHRPGWYRSCLCCHRRRTAFSDEHVYRADRSDDVDSQPASSRIRCSIRSMTASGVDVPAVMPTVPAAANHSRRRSNSVSTWWT